MIISNQPKTRRWYNDSELFLHGLARSNYVTAITDWFMGFAGKWAELVLYATVLYSCAELYPGVHLPAGLSLAVFLVQLGALDIGGLSLAKLAKQARIDGNADGAQQAERLSTLLIAIMLTSVVIVGLEHALPFALPAWLITSIDVLLVVARSIASVLYGKVIFTLRRENDNGTVSPVSSETASSISDETVQLILSKLAKVDELEQALSSQKTTIVEEAETPLALPETAGDTVDTVGDESRLEAQISALLAIKDDLSSREVATIVGKPHSTVYRHLKQVKQA